jgi:hypothetical protein
VSFDRKDEIQQRGKRVFLPSPSGRRFGDWGLGSNPFLISTVREWYSTTKVINWSSQPKPSLLTLSQWERGKEAKSIGGIYVEPLSQEGGLAPRCFENGST